MNYSYGTNADQYLNKEGLDYLIKQLDLKYSGSGDTVDLTNYYDKAEIDNLLSNIDGTVGNDGVGIQSVELVNYELIVTLTDDTVINLGNVRGEKGLQGIQGLDGAKGTDGINGTNGIDGKDGLDGADGIDGRGITSIVKTGTEGLIDTYTITYTDATTTTFTVTNGKDGADGEGGGSSGGNSNVYSTTEEQEIGTWIDGKPIYRKVIDIGILGTNNKVIPHGIVGIDEIINITQRIHAVGKWYTGGGQVKTYATSNYNRNNESIVGVNESDITINAGDDMVDNPYMIILEYTKV